MNFLTRLSAYAVAGGLWWMAGDHGIAAPAATASSAPFRFANAIAGVEDLQRTYGAAYPEGAAWVERLRRLEQRMAGAADAAGAAAVEQEAREILRQALLAHPLLRDGRVLVVKRARRDVGGNLQLWENQRVSGYAAGNGRGLGLPSNHECNSSLERTGYDNELAILEPPLAAGRWRTLYRPSDGGYVGETDLHWDADRLLFTRSDAENWKVFEIGIDGKGLRQVSRMSPNVDSFDACYLPDGGIVFGSTASFQSVPCWHGRKWVSNLYRMEADGSGVRQLCFDQDHDLHPVVLANGQVLYHRWDYTGISHIFLRPLMVMNPDGTGQRAVYGSSSWFPNSLYFPQPLPGQPGLLVSILSGYHGVHKMGQLVLLNLQQGWQEGAGIVQRLSGRGSPVEPRIKDNLVDHDWPKFLHPWPIDERRFLVAAQPDAAASWGLYLADTFDNLVLVREEPGYALLEPVLIRPRPRPPALPSRVDPARTDATVYLHDVYTGPGLAGVPRGTVKRLRVLAYHFGYRHLAGPDKVGLGGPWEVMRILGTTPVEPDGSASFRVPANTPLAVQPLDASGQAVQLMRSWFTAMPGENVSCAGCHESPGESVPSSPSLAATRGPRALKPWHGPARGFDFAREVQPVLDEHCVRCHDGREEVALNLRPETEVPGYRGHRLSTLGVNRLHPDMAKATGGRVRYTPAYEALVSYVRRVGIEDDVSLLTPGEYQADTSPLIQLLRKGHHGVRLGTEDWDRLITWIDLNAPCHGTWHEVFPVPENSREERLANWRRFGGPPVDPEIVPSCPPVSHADDPPSLPDKSPAAALASVEERVASGPPVSLVPSEERVVDLGGGVYLKLAPVPAGEARLGATDGPEDERALRYLAFDRPFWMGTTEVSNAQFRRFDPAHDPRYYNRRHARPDDQGLPLNAPDQPAVRVSWTEAVGFCDWLSARTGWRFRLPTESEWEYACRAGATTAMSFGDVTADYSRHANLADVSFSRGLGKGGHQITGGVDHLVIEGAALADTRFNDGVVVTAPVGRYAPNRWGLYDLHGNAAEWTASLWLPPTDRAGMPEGGAPRRVVRGGSFFDPPRRARAASRLGYPEWRRVFNVGFRVVAELPETRLAAE